MRSLNNSEHLFNAVIYNKTGYEKCMQIICSFIKLHR